MGPFFAMSSLLALLAGFYVCYGSATVQVKYYHTTRDCSSKIPSSVTEVKEGDCITLDTFIKDISDDISHVDTVIDETASGSNFDIMTGEFFQAEKDKLEKCFPFEHHSLKFGSFSYACP